MTSRNAIAKPGLLVVAGLLATTAVAAEIDEIRITNPGNWSCTRVIGVRSFAVVGKFKGEQPQEAYTRLMLAELTTALRAAPGVRDVVEVTPQMAVTPDLVIEGEFLELNTGSRAARFWVGMGAGKAKCAVRIRGLTHPARSPVFELEHARISPFGLDSDELVENVVEVARDVGRALAQARQSCSAEAAAAVSPAAPAAAATPAASSREPDARGVFTIESTPRGAEVYVDGELVGTTPIAEHGLAAGRHEIELQKKGMAVWMRWLTVSAGSRATLAAELEPVSSVSAPQ